MFARILQPTKSSTQSGKGNNKWVLEFVQADDSLSINQSTGWLSTNDTSTQVKLSFNSKELAIVYADKRGIKYEVIEPKVISMTKKAYADNFI